MWPNLPANTPSWTSCLRNRMTLRGARQSVLSKRIRIMHRRFRSGASFRPTDNLRARFALKQKFHPGRWHTLNLHNVCRYRRTSSLCCSPCQNAQRQPFADLAFKNSYSSNFCISALIISRLVRFGRILRISLTKTPHILVRYSSMPARLKMLSMCHWTTASSAPKTWWGPVLAVVPASLVQI